MGLAILTHLGTNRKMARVPPPEIESDGTGIFVSYAGKRIAKRGEPNTPQANTWVSLEPGFVVHDTQLQADVIIEFNGVRVH
jgi:hypothetical protein